MLSKSFWFIFTSFLLFNISFLCWQMNASGSLFFFSSIKDMFPWMEICPTLDKVCLIFMIMVSLVTSLVSLYSEVYMDSYNNKKFFFLMFLFLSFMVMLSMGGDLLMFMLGWDGLGVSSLFLIMFYPNKVTLYNSFLTVFFNRLGDLFLISFFCTIFFGYSNFFFLFSDMSFLSLFFLFFCLLTKSAQIPFSSWLPAAMSAPTPISAMVHSSTLVTAGILVFFKSYSLFLYSFFLSFLSLFCLLTFLLGGFLANVEKDLKKVVAFSTMSQISMILVFLSSALFLISLSHTLCHALFKTLLFCGCGVIFMWSFSDQMKIFFCGGKVHTPIVFLLTLSIYSMSGLSFSSAFSTKDFVLEKSLSEMESSIFLILFIGSVFTLSYSSIIYTSMSEIFITSNSLSSNKYFNFSFFCFFSILSVSFLKIFSMLILDNFSVFMPVSFTMSLSVLLFLFMFFILFKSKKFYLYTNGSVFYMKDIFFSIFSSPLEKKILTFISTDQYFFKPSSLNYLNFLKIGTYKNLFFFIYMIFFFALLF